MVLKTKPMSAEPSLSDGLRICVMRDARIYNRHLTSFKNLYDRHMYDIHLKSLAPPTKLKDDYQQGRIFWEEYVPVFRKEVLETQTELIKAIAYLAVKGNITLLCSEKTPEECHRRLLAEECKKYQPSLETIIE